MTWIYQQVDGWLLDSAGVRLAQGYSGAGIGKNSPNMQDVHNVGPIPQGIYTMNPPVDTTTHGPYVIWLTADPANEMFGRSSFGIHGDSLLEPGKASEGCVVADHTARVRMWQSGDHVLQVVSGMMVTDTEL